MPTKKNRGEKKKGSAISLANLSDLSAYVGFPTKPYCTEMATNVQHNAWHLIRFLRCMHDFENTKTGNGHSSGAFAIQTLASIVDRICPRSKCSHCEAFVESATNHEIKHNWPFTAASVIALPA